MVQEEFYIVEQRKPFWCLTCFIKNNTLAELISMVWVIILHEYKPHSRWDRMMLQYAGIAGLIQLALHLVQIPDFAIGTRPSNHNRASSMLYSWYDTRDCSSFTNSLPHIDPPILPKDFKSK